MRTLSGLFLALALCLLALPSAQAAPAATGPIGPLAQQTHRVQGIGSLAITFIPKEEGKPTQFLGKSFDAAVIATVVDPQVPGHPFECFVAVVPVDANNVPEMTKPLLRCGTVLSGGDKSIPATAITATQAAAKVKGASIDPTTAWTTYSVAPTKGLQVGVINYGDLVAKAEMEDTLGKQLHPDSFTVALGQGSSLRFYTEIALKSGTFAIVCEAKEWTYIQ
ncbi:MAG: hypothetical protein ABI743_03315 [bacterium]